MGNNKDTKQPYVSLCQALLPNIYEIIFSFQSLGIIGLLHYFSVFSLMETFGQFPVLLLLLLLLSNNATKTILI